MPVRPGRRGAAGGPGSGGDGSADGAVGPGIDGGAEAPSTAPLRLPAGFAVPGDGPARAVLFGSEGDHPAIELVEVDTGRVAWRDRALCAAPVVGTTPEVIVCADAGGTRAIGLDGRPRWRTG
jgi:hypothetical protein